MLGVGCLMKLNWRQPPVRLGLLPIRNRRIRPGIQPILLRVPQIAVRFVRLRTFSLFALDLGQTFLLLVSRAGGLSRFAAYEKSGTQDQSDQLNWLHVSQYRTNSLKL